MCHVSVYCFERCRTPNQTHCLPASVCPIQLIILLISIPWLTMELCMFNFNWMSSNNLLLEPFICYFLFICFMFGVSHCTVAAILSVWQNAHTLIQQHSAYITSIALHCTLVWCILLVCKIWIRPTSTRASRQIKKNINNQMPGTSTVKQIKESIRNYYIN